MDESCGIFRFPVVRVRRGGRGFLLLSDLRAFNKLNFGLWLCPAALSEQNIMDYLLLAFSVTDWFSDSWYELRQYAGNLNKTHWGIMAATSCLFGFLCLRGNTLRI